MGHTIIRGEIHSDNTGVATEIPVLVTEHGPLIPLVEYFKERAEVRSQNWMTKLAQAVGLLIEYMDANHDCFKDTKDLFTTFVLRLSSGTVDKDGMDPSGLYWSGRNPALVRQLGVDQAVVSPAAISITAGRAGCSYRDRTDHTG